MNSIRPHTELSLLLMSRNPAWHTATAAALKALGAGRIEVAEAPMQALDRLLTAAGGYTHMLVDTAHAAAWLDVFVGMTVGEAGSGTALVRLGADDGAVGDTPLVPSPDWTMIANSLSARTTAPADSSPLSRFEIESAFAAGCIGCRFQPIVRMSDRRPVGLEILSRLNHPVRGWLPPNLFIPQMEQAGLSLQLTDAVFECCLGSIDFSLLKARGLFLSLNLPLDALLMPESLDQIDARRADAGLEPGSMLIELTESRPVNDIPALAAALERWRAIGYRLAIDDLGPSVVNQSILVDMPFHTVKLDKQIVLRSRTDALAHRYLQRTVTNARSRCLSIIAEGIEDEAMWDRMVGMGVQQAQGFYIARALPAAALPVWMDFWDRQPGAVPGTTM